MKVPDLTEGMVAEYVSKDPKAKPQSIHNQLVKIGQLQISESKEDILTKTC